MSILQIPPAMELEYLRGRCAELVEQGNYLCEQLVEMRRERDALRVSILSSAPPAARAQIQPLPVVGDSPMVNAKPGCSTHSAYVLGCGECFGILKRFVEAQWGEGIVPAEAISKAETEKAMGSTSYEMDLAELENAKLARVKEDAKTREHKEREIARVESDPELADELTRESVRKTNPPEETEPARLTTPIDELPPGEPSKETMESPDAHYGRKADGDIHLERATSDKALEGFGGYDALKEEVGEEAGEGTDEPLEDAAEEDAGTETNSASKKHKKKKH